jgi:phage terminase Nu1 subunit (DNA packaging protein)
MSESQGPTISADKLEALTGLTDRRHRQLAKEGYFAPPQGGQYQFASTLRGLFKYFREDRNKASQTLNSERLRKLHEEADKVALENEKTRGNLVEIEAVYKHFEGIFVAFRARVLASSLTDEEKDELLNDLRKLKARDIPKSGGVEPDTRPAVIDPNPAAEV